MKNLSFFGLVFISLLLGACGNEPAKSAGNTPHDQEEPTVAQPDPALEAATQKISGILNGYYQDLSNEQIDESKYYAPTVVKFFSSNNLPREKVGQSIKSGFKSVSNRDVRLTPSSLKVEIIDNGYLARFSGTSAYTKDSDGSEVKQDFSNQVIFDENYKITHYETLDESSTAKSRTIAPNRVSISGATSLASTLLAMFKTGQVSVAQKYIHPEKGFYFLTHPGAMSVVYSYQDINDIFIQAPWLKDGIEELRITPKEESLPSFDCGDFFSKEGCFIGKIEDSYSEMSGLMTILNQVEPDMYDATKINKAKDLEKYVTVQIVDTKANFSFYLGEIDGKWYLLIVDIASYDCSA